MKTIVWRLIAVAAIVLLSGCPQMPTKQPYTPPQSRDEAAAILMSVTSVASWSQVADAVQPNFTLTADAALQQVAPTTIRIQEQVLNAFGLSLGIGLPQSSSTSSATTNQGSSQSASTSGGATTSAATATNAAKSASTATRQPGSAPQAPSGTPAGALPLSAPAVAGGVDIDPILKYQAALALYQSVQLMNRQVQTAASISCFAPYLVQLKLAILPYRRDLPYDVHARISFFGGAGGASTTATSRASNENGQASAPSAPVEKKQQASEECKKTAAYLPQILPILVTDDIERAIKSSAVETARQIGFALGAMVHGLGANAAINKLDQTLEALSGQDINSRFTVARLTDNTVYVRIGATNSATTRTALVGQTYDVSLLLLVPVGYFGQSGEQPEEIQVTAHTEFRESKSGAILPIRPVKSLVLAAHQAMQEVLSGDLLDAWNAASDKNKEDVARRLSCPIQVSSFIDLTRCGSKKTLGEYLEAITLPKLNKPGETVSFAELSGSQRRVLWNRLSILSADSPFKTSFIALPKRPKVSVSSQTVLLLDDTKETTQAQLQRVSGVSARVITATLLLKDLDRGRDYELPAQGIAFDPTTQVLSLSFPSLAKMGIANIALEKSGLSIAGQPCPESVVCPVFELPKEPLKLLYLAAEAKAGATPHFDFTSKQSAIVTTGGKAVFTASISKLKDDEAIISSDNADIASAVDGAGNTLTVTNGQVKVTKDMKNTNVVLQLQGVNAGLTVGITAEGKKAGKSTGKTTIKLLAVAK